MDNLNYAAERESDVSKIKTSVHPRKVVVAGPGTGKSFLFQELIKAKKLEGKKDFLAITFIGKLGDSLADDLCGLAETMTMHGFARKFFMSKSKGWEYYPDIYDIIREDLEREGIKEFKIGDENYKRKSVYYKAVGNADVIFYAVQICKKDSNNIPRYDLVLVDEFQDFNEIESEFVDLLSQKNEIVIVGDDDQALYGFKGSSPLYIRNKHNNANTDFESHTLRFCSRCPEVIIRYFHDIVKKFTLNDPTKNRIQKEYICYAPEKEKDSVLNPNIHLIKNCPSGMVAYKVRSELEKIIVDQKIKDVLIVGEGKSCPTILLDTARQLSSYGFKNIDYKKESTLNINQKVIAAYKFISKNGESLLGWRILGNPTDKITRNKHERNSKTLNVIIDGTPSSVNGIKEIYIDNLEIEIGTESIPDKVIRRNVLIQEIKNNNIILPPRPLGNLNITVCNILNSKGLGADVVFVIGFDQGRFPAKDEPTDSEIYQMLVALTRTKKRIYFIGSAGKKVSSFIDCLDKTNLTTEEIKLK